VNRDRLIVRLIVKELYQVLEEVQGLRSILTTTSNQIYRRALQEVLNAGVCLCAVTITLNAYSSRSSRYLFSQKDGDLTQIVLRYSQK
jgi:hypothetical protein